MAHPRSDRRRFLRAVGAGGVAALLAPAAPGLALAAPGAQSSAPAYTLPPLPYAYSALEPYIDEQTMILHHTKHHAAYVAALNGALASYPAWQGRDIVDLLYHIEDVPEDVRTTVKNNGGGFLNHAIFWATMGPGGGGQPVGPLADAIRATFGDFATLQAHVNDAASKRFGSGWAWLVLDGDGVLQVIGRSNQDAPVMEGYAALVGVDVWEHAYYLKYQNRRADYLKAWWNVVNWESVGLRYAQARAVLA